MSTTPSQTVRVLYTAEATATGGRKGHGRTSDGRVDVDFSSPTEMGGDGGPGTNPEQLFATGFAACFQNAMMSIARRKNISGVDDSIVTARIGIGPIENRPTSDAPIRTRSAATSMSPSRSSSLPPNPQPPWACGWSSVCFSSLFSHL
jgi:Ohr subfamily peroxiredoxin